MSESFDVHALTDDELESLRRAVLSEKAKRKEVGTSPEKIEAAIAEYQVASGKGQGEPWERPVTALDAYREGAEVEDEGEVWVSTHANNTAKPGVSGWRLKPELDEGGNEIPPPYVPPSGAHDSYGKGERVTHNGQVWEAVRSGVVHSPDEYAPDWRLIEPEPESEPEPPEDEEPVDPEEPEPEPGDGDEDDEPTEPEPEEDLPDEWVQPGGHNPYNTGDRVLWQGSVYESMMDGNVWNPTDHPAGWERQG